MKQDLQVLLIDDDTNLQLTLSDYMRFRGIGVTVASSAEEALALLKTSVPDLVILDINMPGMGGVAFLKELTDGDGRRPYPILVLTARAAMETFFEELDVDGFIAKPCSGRTLMTRIGEILAAKSQERVRVLVAESDEQMGRTLRESLESEGFDVSLMRSGPNVVESAPRLRPHIVLLSETLPGMNGSAVAPILSAMPSTEGVPIVLYDRTGWLDEKQRLERRRFTGVSNLVSPADVATLRAVVRRLVVPDGASGRRVKGRG